MPHTDQVDSKEEWMIVVINSFVGPHCRVHYKTDDDNDDVFTILTLILTFFNTNIKLESAAPFIRSTK
jgi:hypothetical protein